MKISVIIPAHNEERVIEKCLDSLLMQTKKPYEIITVDDNSTDNTYKILKKYSKKSKLIRILKLGKGEGGSAAASRNRASEKAKGEYLVFVDADQIMEKKFIEKIIKYLKQNPVDSTDYLVYSYKPRTIFQKGWSIYRKVNPTMNMPHIIRTSVFKKLKYNENIFYYEDGEIKHRLLEKGYTYSGPTTATIHHIDTKTFSDFHRQRKWQGKGILNSIRAKDYSNLRHFLPCFTLIFPIPIFSVILYMIVFWVRFSLITRRPIDSFYWVFIDLFGRFLSLYYFLKFSFE